MLLDTHLGPDGREYVTRKHAAQLVGVHPDTVSGWVGAGYLKPLDGCPPRKQLFALDDIADAEHLAREAALRTSGSDSRTRRNLAA